MKTIKLFIYLFIVTLLVQACKSDNVYYESFHSLDNNQWVHQAPQVWEIDIDEPKKVLDINYSLRHNLDYGYSNIFVKYTLIAPSGDTLIHKQKETELLNPNTGEPKGDGASQYTYYDELLPEYSFDKKGKYKLVLQSHMREDTLHNLIAVGVRLDKETIEQ